MVLALLGPLQVNGNGRLSPRDRVVLSALAVHAGDPLTAERLADALWGAEPPASWAKVVQGSIMRLRRTLGRDAVLTTTGGYRLVVGDDEIDIRRFERLVTRGAQLATTGEHGRAAVAYGQALDLWRGAPLADLEHWPDGRAEAIRLDELRRTTEEARLDARLAAGHDVVADAAALVGTGQLREHRWWLLAMALYRAGRQSEALEAIRRARRTLQEELGLDPGRELADLEQAILNQEPGLDGPAIGDVAVDGRCPWKGLLVYDRDDSDWFFGRDREVHDCLRALRSSPLLVVAGPSGSGKSSIVRAGLVPALVRAGENVTVLTPGTDPAAALVAAVASAHTSAVLVVDQLEELFTAGHPATAVTAFLDQLVALAASGTRVVAVVRADQIGGLSASPGMARMVEQGLHLVTPMSAEALREAVEGPAAQAGLRIEPGLVDLLVSEIEDEPGALPLLSHALAETWVRREAGVLTVDGYRATGGIRGAVAQSAEQMWESLPAEQRGVVRALWLRLVAPTADGEPTAVRVPLPVAAPDAERQRVVDLLVRCRLVTTDDRTVTVAHEAVIRAWPRLRSWLDEDAAGLLTLRHLSVAADDWDGRGRPDSELYRGGRLEAAQTWRQRAAPALTPVEEAFLDAGAARELADRQRAQAAARHRRLQNRRLRTALVATALGLVLALLAGSVAVQRSREASRTATDALIDKLAAQSVALRSTQRDLAALLAAEAYRLRDTARTRSALFGVFTAAPGLLGYLPTGSGGLRSGQVLTDGSLVAVGPGGVVRLLSLDDGREIATLPQPTGSPTGALLAVSRDEGTVAEVSWDGAESGGGQSVLSVYDLGARTRRLPDVPLPLDAGAVAVSPDGRFVAVSGADDGRVLVYDTEGRSELPDLPAVDETTPGVLALPAVGPAARLEAVQDFVAGRTEEILVFRADPRLEDPRLRPPGEGNTVETRYTAALVFRPDGLLVAGSETGVVRVVDPLDGRVESRLTGAPWLTSNRVAALSEDGRLLVTAGTRGVVAWDLERGALTWVADVDGANCSALVIEPRSRSVLCGGRYSRVVALDLATGRRVPSAWDLQRGEISALLLSPDGRTLVELSRREGVVARWSLDGHGPVTRSLESEGTPAFYTSDGSLLVTTRTTGRDAGGFVVREAQAIRPGTGEVVWSAGDNVAVAAAGPRRIVTWTTPDTGSVVDLRTGRGQQLEGDFAGFSWDAQGVPPGGDHLLGLVTGTGGSLTHWASWDLRTGSLDAVRADESGGHGTLSPDGRVLLEARDGRLAAYDLSEGDVLDAPPVATRPGVARAVMSDRRLVAASMEDGRVSFFRGGRLAPVGPLLQETPGEVEQLTFSADGRVLAVRTATGSLRLVDAGSRLQLGEPIELGLDRARVVALRPDGREVAVRTDDGLRIWDLRPGRWARAVCDLVGRSLSRAEWSTYLSAVGPYRPTC